MNIEQELKFDPEKPATHMIKRSEKINVIAVGLLKDQLLQKHKTLLPTFLTVVKGEIEFHINNEKLELNTLDTFQIPVDVLHEVLGLDEKNIFTLTQEK